MKLKEKLEQMLRAQQEQKEKEEPKQELSPLCYKCGKHSKKGELYYSSGKQVFLCKTCKGRRAGRATEQELQEQMKNACKEALLEVFDSLLTD